MPKIAKPLRGIDRGVHELRASGPDNTYGVVYLVRLSKGIYVLDAFVKKSTRGIATPKHIIDRVRRRLRRAEEEDATWRA